MEYLYTELQHRGTELYLRWIDRKHKCKRHHITENPDVVAVTGYITHETDDRVLPNRENNSNTITSSVVHVQRNFAFYHDSIDYLLRSESVLLLVS